VGADAGDCRAVFSRAGGSVPGDPSTATYTATYTVTYTVACTYANCCGWSNINCDGYCIQCGRR